MSEPSQSRGSASGLDRIRQMHFSFAAERVLSVSVQFDVFSAIAKGNKTLAEIAEASGASRRGMRMLLDALVGYELLTKMGDRYELSLDADRYLVRNSPDYLGAIMEQDQLWSAWSHLGDAVRSGKPPRSASNRQEAEQFFPTLVRTLHITNREPARLLAAQLVKPGAKDGLRVIDIGCGSGVWSLAIAKADPNARVTAFDFDKVLETTRHFVDREGLSDRYQFLPGDLREAQFPSGQYDLAILGNIVHGESETSARDLFIRIHRALKPQGLLAIIDMIPNNARTKPLFPLLFALNMLLNTDAGDTYTMAEYREWLGAAGFGRIDTIDVASDSPVIVAAKG